MTRRKALAGSGSFRAGAAMQPSAGVIGILCGAGAALSWAAGLVAARHGIAIGFTPSDMALHRYVWADLAFIPILVRDGIADPGGIGWGRSVVLTIFAGPMFAILSYAGFMLVPLCHGGVIQPSCAALGGILLATLVLKERLPASRVIGSAAIISGLLLLGAEALTTIGAHGGLGDLLFVAAGLSWAIFGTLLKLWRIAPTRAAGIVSVLSLAYVPVHWASFGFGNMIAAGL